MKIVIDTNAVHNDYLFRGAAIGALAKSRAKVGCDLLMPAVVFAEHLKHFREARNKAAAELKEVAARASALFDRPVDVPALVAGLDDSEQVMRSRLVELGITVMDHPKDPHDGVAARAVARIPPFSKDGRGYQDTLVWLSALSLVDEDPVIVVTSDSAFGQTTLDPALEEEARAKIEAAAPRLEISVSLAKTLGEILKKHVEPRLNRLTQFETDLQSGSARLNLQEWLKVNLTEIVHDYFENEAHPSDVPAGELGPVTLSGLTVRGAHAVSEREAYVTVKAEAKLSVGGWRWFQIGHDDFDRDWVDDEVSIVVDLELLVSGEEDVAGFTVVTVTTPRRRSSVEVSGEDLLE